MIKISRDNWRHTDQGIYVKCPGKCGNEFLLDHNVRRNGAVLPSLQCPSPTDQCSFHDNVILEGWFPPGATVRTIQRPEDGTS